jgi:hypothetical protein
MYVNRAVEDCCEFECRYTARTLNGPFMYTPRIACRAAAWGNFARREVSKIAHDLPTVHCAYIQPASCVRRVYRGPCWVEGVPDQKHVHCAYMYFILVYALCTG